MSSVWTPIPFFLAPRQEADAADFVDAAEVQRIYHDLLDEARQRGEPLSAKNAFERAYRLARQAKEAVPTL